MDTGRWITESKVSRAAVVLSDNRLRENYDTRDGSVCVMFVVVFDISLG